MAVKHVKTEEFEAVVETAPLAMLDFWADWCGPCKMLSPTIDQIGEQYEGKAIIGKVNVDEEQGLAMRYGVMSIPTIVYFKNGKEIDRKVGVQPISAFTSALDANL